MEDTCLRNAVVHHLIRVREVQGHGRFHFCDRRTGVDIAKVFLCQHFGTFDVDIPCQNQNGIGRAVIVLKPLLHGLQRSRAEVLHRPNGAMTVGMPWREQRLENPILNLSIRSVVALPLLVLHHTNLVVELFLCHRAQQVAHTI